MQLSQNLDKLMMDNNVSAYKISKDTGISDRLIGYWRSGEKLPGAENLLIIANYFGISVDYLLTGKEKSSSTELSEDEQRLLSMYKSLDDMEKGEILGELKVMTRYRADKDQQVRIAARSVGSNEPLDNEILKKLDILDNIPEADEE